MVKGLVVVISVLIAFILFEKNANSEGWNPQITQSPLTCSIKDKKVNSEQQNYSLSIYQKVVLSGLTFNDFLVLRQIAMCESSLRHFDANGGVLSGYKVKADSGLFQINKYYHEASAESKGLDLNNPEDNIQYAIDLYKEQGTTPWNASRLCWDK